MVLIDTSIWVALFRDNTGKEKAFIEDTVQDDEIVLTRFNQLELLQGCKDENDWGLLSSYLDSQTYLEATSETWSLAGRIYYDLRRRGKTISSPIGCCIAQIAIENETLLIHRDNDFNMIADIRPLIQQYIKSATQEEKGEEKRHPQESR